MTGKLTDERFIKLSRDYEREQNNVRVAIEATRKELKGKEQKRIKVKGEVIRKNRYGFIESLSSGR